MMAAGWWHSILVDTNGQVWSTGCNSHGQLGLEGTDSRHGFERVQLDTHVSCVAAGMRHTLAIGDEGFLWCWGARKDGQLALTLPPDSQNAVFQPQMSTLGTGIKEIVAGAKHSACIRSDGTVSVWGGGRGRAPWHDSGPEPRVIPLPEGVMGCQLASGWSHVACVGDDGGIYTSGRSDYGQCGHGSNSAPWIDHFQKVKGLDAIAKVACGAEHTICLSLDGRVFTWGWGDHGQLGSGGTENIMAPAAVVVSPLIGSALPPAQVVAPGGSVWAGGAVSVLGWRGSGKGA